MTISIFVVGAGLQWSNGPGSLVTVDRDAARVCETAALVAAESPTATVYITAGWAEEYGVHINTVYADYLESCGVSASRIVTEPARGWGTNAEVEAFLAQHRKAVESTGRLAAKSTIIVVNRDFHIRRTMMLLRARLTTKERVLTMVNPRPVRSGERRQNLVREPVALIKDWVLHVLPRLFTH